MGTIKKHTTVLDGKPYTCETFPATEGLVIIPKLLALLGDDVANLIFSTDDAEIAELMGNTKVMAAMLMKISMRVSETDGLLVLRDLLQYTTCDKVQVGEAELTASVYERFDTHFAADYLHLIKVVQWVARASFASP